MTPDFKRANALLRRNLKIAALSVALKKRTDIGVKIKKQLRRKHLIEIDAEFQMEVET